MTLEQVHVKAFQDAEPPNEYDEYYMSGEAFPICGHQGSGGECRRMLGHFDGILAPPQYHYGWDSDHYKQWKVTGC